FILKNTLSENGGVTRGVCCADENGYLTDVLETSNIVNAGDHADADGKVIDLDSHVSMNFWGFTPEFVKMLETGFVEFFKTAVPENPLKAEYLIPIYIGELLREGKVSVKVLETPDKWFGVTYKEDKPLVVESFKKLIADGEYSSDLYSDM
ncbi:MAG: nucleotidyltransferase, partial [Clostridia bacterium]|nr:nucleotidyltransferase [Clostridia bacterium]